jgi:hypothetical protein
VLAKLPKANDERLLSYLQVLSELALSARQVFAEKAEEVMEFVHDNVLQRESPVSKSSAGYGYELTGAGAGRR